jgi:hypothetical protein
LRTEAIASPPTLFESVEFHATFLRAVCRISTATSHSALTKVVRDTAGIREQLRLDINPKSVGGFCDLLVLAFAV